MANTPPAPKKPGVVIPLPKKPRDDDTQSFVTEGSPKSRKEIVVGGPAVRDDDTERTTLVDTPTVRRDPAEVRRGPPPLPTSREPDLRLPTRTYARGAVIANFYDCVGEALLIKRGRLMLEVLDLRTEERERTEGREQEPVPLKDFRIEIGPRQILFEELLSSQGDGGIVSDFRATAKEETEAYVLTLDDLVDPDVAHVTLRARLYAVLDASSSATGRSRKQEILHWEEENAWLKALDETKQRTYELEVENGGLKQEVMALREQNRQLTRETITEASIIAFAELQNRYRTLREAREQDQAELLEVRQKLASMTGEMNELLKRQEELEDYDALRKQRPEIFYSRLALIFYSLLAAVDDIELQQLALRGMSLLHGRAKPPSSDST